MRKLGWAVLALFLTPLLSPLIGSAEAQTRNEMSQLKHELQALREEVETKNTLVKRMQQRLEALETKMQVEIQRPVDEKLKVMKEEIKTEMAAKAESPKLLGGQVFFKGGYARMDSPRSNSLLTAQDNPDDRNGFNVGAGLDLPLMTIFNSTLLGEIYVEYIQTQHTTGDSSAKVETPPDKVLAEGKGLENILTVGIAPKFRFDNLGSIRPWLAPYRPWIIPVGLTFNVNTPVNKAITNISIGGVTGIGIERLFWNNRLSLGIDARYYWGPDIPDENLKHLTTSGYVGINF
ncbi:hypothetical protein CLG94_07180 [Candidatus Methylomirabilis limnetica]|jgi:hypothetical protein|uniref:Outer membrane protein beta-barrel domain-containing protein n=1 Tax=Candidatus Methylomirabilis limnetica TaxID=2033718 RepID=A0A2T4TWS7_9BACT|nr:hypothetical protein [Candidatus Methylomirabilis limnetica]PTL35557.1 hypothetical protein CLG94_07180 [Candidatus Methylomirabilis limnetica]